MSLRILRNAKDSLARDYEDRKFYLSHYPADARFTQALRKRIITVALLFFAEKSREKAEQNIFFFFISLSLSLSLFFSRRNTNVLLYHSLTLDIGASVPLGTRREVGWNPTNRE